MTRRDHEAEAQPRMPREETPKPPVASEKAQLEQSIRQIRMYADAAWDRGHRSRADELHAYARKLEARLLQM